MKFSVILIAVILMTVSCVTQRRCNAKFPILHDTLRITILHDTIIFRDRLVPIHFSGDTVNALAPAPCPQIPNFIPDTARAETALASAKAWLQFPNVYLQLIQKDTTIITRLEKAEQETIHWKSEYEQVKQTREVKYIPTIYKICLWSWIGVFILALLYIIIRLLKPIKLI